MAAAPATSTSRSALFKYLATHVGRNLSGFRDIEVGSTDSPLDWDEEIQNAVTVHVRSFNKRNGTTYACSDLTGLAWPSADKVEAAYRDSTLATLLERTLTDSILDAPVASPSSTAAKMAAQSSVISTSAVEASEKPRETPTQPGRIAACFGWLAATCCCCCSRKRRVSNDAADPDSRAAADIA